MKKSVEMIYNQYPHLEKYDMTKNDVERDRVLYALTRFFLYPDTEYFDLKTLYVCLENQDLQLALNAIQTFFSQDTYLLREDVEPMILQPEQNPLMNQKGFVDLLVEHGLNFDKSKLNVYKNRGLLPIPSLYISGKPYWYKSQILKYIQKNKSSETKNSNDDYVY